VRLTPEPQALLTAGEQDFTFALQPVAGNVEVLNVSTSARTATCVAALRHRLAFQVHAMPGY
jgi:hypothetical protein